MARRPERIEPTDRLERLAADVTDADDVRRAVADADAVLWAIGPTRNHPAEVLIAETGVTNLVTAMTERGVTRLVAISGAGITLNDERKPIGGRVMSAVVRVLARHVFEAKRREYELVRASSLEWTLVRPPRIVAGPRTGRVVIGESLASREVTEGDVADAMLRQLADRTFVRGAPFASTPSEARPAS